MVQVCAYDIAEVNILTNVEKFALHFICVPWLEFDKQKDL